MSKISNMKLRYKVALGASVLGASILAGGVAFAYFTSTGNGTGAATVGSPMNWSVALASVSPTSGTLYPCGATALTVACASDQETLTFTITNNDNGNQLLTYTNLQTAIDSALGTESPTPHTDIVTGGSNSQPNDVVNPATNLMGASPVNNCLASWFGSEVTSLNGHQADVDVAGNSTATVIVTVGMEDASAVQNPCMTATPDVDLWVS